MCLHALTFAPDKRSPAKLSAPPTQGVNRRPLFIERSEEEHARLRKHFGAFFSAENLGRVIERLFAEADAACDDIMQRALQSADGRAGAEVLQMGGAIINRVVQKV